MAKQKGILKLKGTMGDVTFYKTADGYLAREKGGVDKNRIMSDPKFKRTRENGMEFGTAGKAGQLIRKANRLLLRQASDNRVISRLVRSLMLVIQSDTINRRGLRTVQDGDMSLLHRFDFNQKAKLDTVFFSGYSHTFDRMTGLYEVEIADFVPKDTIEAPRGTTHIKISAAVSALDFLGRSFEEDHDETPMIPWDDVPQAAITLTANVSGGSLLPILQLIGVSFYQEVNGEMYLLRNGVFNALSIVGVDQV
ncbi:hypothetical protein [Aequorivita viscosa]|uniref:Uncharacterized protein n=1 Tax=Aequorivita viscosa TaxID=797419 RepID=A0A1M6GKU7_9FLAO|nr:hypothetical protein [Aequorivita viscosa]SDW83508.1 hypothetical protein SAMN05216556_1115 [Aequorivita viscosa]SHJ10533.1 hypothetical protein SAMN04487908_109109 [Aequorivita viscosa]